MSFALRRSILCSAIYLAAGWLCVGCASEPHFRATVETHIEDGQTVLSFDTNDDGHPDYWQYQHPEGRKTAIAYVDDRGDPGQCVELDEIAAADCPHFVIILDGVPFEVVDQMYADGHFRLFHPPSRVVCCYPGMTDLALADLLHTRPCVAYEANYFDRAANRFSNGNQVYLSGANSPWLPLMDYRCSTLWDILVYLNPGVVFNHEMAGFVRTLHERDSGQAYVYSVGTAGLGTRGGRPAIEEYLRTVDRLCEQIVHERRGRVKITVTADHGHNLTENRRVSFRKLLTENGFRVRKSLDGPRDVAIMSYGLVTYAAMFTDDPAAVAECLLRHPDVEFACYPVGETLVVRDRAGEAVIRELAGELSYDTHAGDPLGLEPILADLREAGLVAPDGAIDADALFSATVMHKYPDPVARLWRAFHGLVDHPADLIVNLRDGACHGSKFFNTMLGRVASTHGSLNNVNSTTFVLTTLGELPPALRASGVLPALEELRQPPGAAHSILNPRSSILDPPPQRVMSRSTKGLTSSTSTSPSLSKSPRSMLHCGCTSA